ncbi:MAG: hypothetical protein L6Q74_05345 [Sphaerotilus natans subsp. sulfidivorans]|uniref:hypothetical protein n=1 Tax=Sphaerotilus sulfidivorans TaxID=639200 RepID=UPI0023524D44|nr:hypothetical protein [Sphaerotilus sulfidivorans]MCK6401325.1 hypothetical protein [Sphaerotilus sulfidivorans]
MACDFMPYVEGTNVTGGVDKVAVVIRCFTGGCPVRFFGFDKFLGEQVSQLLLAWWPVQAQDICAT